MCKIIIGAFFGLALMGLAGTAQAGLISATTGDLLIFSGGTNAEGLDNLNQSSPTSTTPITRTLSGLNPDIKGDATIQFSAAGDFDFSGENVSLTIDGIDLGIFLNDTPGDDSFDNVAFGDVGFEDASDGTSTADAMIDLSAALADGSLDLVFQFGPFTHDVSGTNFLRVDITYTVPEPATFGIFAIGLAGLGVLARRRRRHFQGV